MIHSHDDDVAAATMMSSVLLVNKHEDVLSCSEQQ